MSNKYLEAALSKNRLLIKKARVSKNLMILFSFLSLSPFTAIFFNPSTSGWLAVFSMVSFVIFFVVAKANLDYSMSIRSELEIINAYKAMEMPHRGMAAEQFDIAVRNSVNKLTDK